jgi:hypothetical protein
MPESTILPLHLEQFLTKLDFVAPILIALIASTSLLIKMPNKSSNKELV